MAKKVGTLTLFFLATVAAVATAATKGQEASAPTDPAVVLSRTRDAMGFGHAVGVVIQTKWISAEEHPYESDRTYPPFFSMMTQGESWSDPLSGVNRSSAQIIYPGEGPGLPRVTVSNSTSQYSLHENAPATPMLPDGSRNLNAWLVVSDWSNASDLRYVGRMLFRDYPRIVLSRMTATGEQRLFIDDKTGFPVKLEYEETHYLWGQRKIQYLFSNWQQSGAVFTANSAFRIADDEVEISRTVGSVSVTKRDGVPSMEIGDVPMQPLDPIPLFLRPIPPKVVDVSANTKILSNPGYNETITLVGDEIYVFDATQGEERARRDHEIVRSLYPEARKINVVITDLAWPHVAGLRYWVANGATIISHKSAREFLQKVLDKHWTKSPDSYEKSRNTMKFNFIGIDKPLQLADGKISLHPIDGIGSEVALMAFIAPDRFLWASDYIQTLASPTMYAMEVIQAVKGSALRPERVAAEHLSITEWQKVVDAQEATDKR
jgi:hypothetical protein